MITIRTGPQPADLTDVRTTNLAVALRYVRAHAPCSRADIAAATGLNKATVSSLVVDLIDRRLVRETGLTEHRIGRPATMLVVDGAPYAGVGIEIGADQLTVVAVDLAGTELLSWRRAFDGLATSAAPTSTPGRAVGAIAALARRAVARLSGQGRRVLGLTVGVPGLVDNDGIVRLAGPLGWRDVALGADLRAALRDPAYDVAVENDANLAALAEYRLGAYAGAADLVHLTGGAGIGAGVIADGRLLRGGRGLAGEIGHVPVAPAGRSLPPCSCGRRGCLEAVAGIPALIRRVLPDTAADGPLTDFAPEVDRIAGAARHGDPAVLDALAEVGRHLGYAGSLLANLVNPEVVLLGGYYLRLAPWLLPAADAELAARTVAPEAGGCRLVASALGPGAAAIGGAARTLAMVDAGQLPSPDGVGAVPPPRTPLVAGRR